MEVDGVTGLEHQENFSTDSHKEVCPINELLNELLIIYVCIIMH